MLRVSYDEIVSVLTAILLKHRLQHPRAELLARLVANASRDGVPSHGLSAFPRIIKQMIEGEINSLAEPELIDSIGIVERWDGRHGLGPLNAWHCMGRAIELARSNGIGCATLRHTNHWLRAGNYGWQAAEAGCIGICWTNTSANVPPWGAKSNRIGNNPLVVAAPRSAGHVVLDMAISQFSYGRAGQYKAEGRQFPVPAGYDESGNLTTDPEALAKSRRHLPIGYWKGSGLAIMLDIVATLLSGGLATHQVKSAGNDVSQIFIAFDAARFAPGGRADAIAEEIIASVHSAEPAGEGERVLYPGERTIEHRRDSMANGVPVEEKVWEKVRGL